MVYWLISNLESISAFYPDFVHQEGASNACELLSDLDSFEVRGSKNGASLILFSPQGPKNRLILRHPCGGKVGTTPKVLGSFGTGTGGTASAVRSNPVGTRDGEACSHKRKASKSDMLLLSHGYSYAPYWIHHSAKLFDCPTTQYCVHVFHSSCNSSELLLDWFFLSNLGTVIT